jgi:Peptidase A4 family
MKVPADRWIVLGVLGGLLTGLVPAAASGAIARPSIVSMRVTPAGVLPASGARVTVRVRVRNASRCKFLWRRAPGSPLSVFRTRSCSGGRAGVTFPAVRNRSHSAEQLTYAVKAIRPGQRAAHRSVTRQESGASTSSAPPTASLKISPQTLQYTGGPVRLSYSSSNATSCELSVTPSGLWPGSNPLEVACNGTTTINNVALSLTARQWKITLTAKAASGQRAVANGTLTQLAKPILQSPNWSGYVLPSQDVITSVVGTFTVPTLNCAETPNAGMSTWVGIGGWGTSTGDLLQTGVRSNCAGGAQIDSPWWRENPEVAETTFSGMTISPGDQITASVYRSADVVQWETCLQDLTTGKTGLMVTGEAWGVSTGGCAGTFAGQGTTTTLSYAGGTTAEWIVGTTPTPFAAYGTITFSNLDTSLLPWSLDTSNEVELAQAGTVLSTPSAPNGNGFTATYTG